MEQYSELHITLKRVQQRYWLFFDCILDKQVRYYKCFFLSERVLSFHIQGVYDLLLLSVVHSHYFVLYRIFAGSSNSNLIAFYRVFATCIDWLTYYFVIDFSNLALISAISRNEVAYVISLRNSFAFTSAIWSHWLLGSTSWFIFVHLSIIVVKVRSNKGGYSARSHHQLFCLTHSIVS